MSKKLLITLAVLAGVVLLLAGCVDPPGVDRPSITYRPGSGDRPF